MTTSQVEIQEPAADATAIRRERREHRIVGMVVASLGALLFVTCVNTELACAEVLGRVLVQQQQHIRAAAIAKPHMSAGLLPETDS